MHLARQPRNAPSAFSIGNDEAGPSRLNSAARAPLNVRHESRQDPPVSSYTSHSPTKRPRRPSPHDAFPHETPISSRCHSKQIQRIALSKRRPSNAIFDGPEDATERGRKNALTERGPASPWAEAIEVDGSPFPLNTLSTQRVPVQFRTT